MKQRLTEETREHDEQEASVAQDQQAEYSMVFESAEALIRHDAAQTAVPPGLRDRVMDSIARESRENTSTPWWKRWMPF